MKGQIQQGNEAGQDQQQAQNQPSIQRKESHEVIQNKLSNAVHSSQSELPPIQTKQSNLAPVQTKQSGFSPYQSPAGQKSPIQAKQRPVQRNTDNSKSSGNVNEAQVKANVSNIMGVDVTQAKVNYNSSKPTQLKAEAYAQGNTVEIAPGKEKHLGHELAHIGQQAQGRVQPTIQGNNGIGINNDPKLEKEADDIGDKAMSMQPTQMKQSGTMKSSVGNTQQGAPVQGKFTHSKKPLNAYGKGGRKAVENLIGSKKIKLFDAALKSSEDEGDLRKWMIANGLVRHMSKITSLITFKKAKTPKMFGKISKYDTKRVSRQEFFDMESHEDQIPTKGWDKNEQTNNWEEYKESYMKKSQTYENGKDFLSKWVGKHLYHGAPGPSAVLIMTTGGGLKPKNPSWSSKVDGKQDGLLSFAFEESGAAALWGSASTNVVFRVTLSKDDLPSLKKISSNEAITTRLFTKNRLQFRRLNSMSGTWYSVKDFEKSLKIINKKWKDKPSYKKLNPKKVDGQRNTDKGLAALARLFKKDQKTIDQKSFQQEEQPKDWFETGDIVNNVQQSQGLPNSFSVQDVSGQDNNCLIYAIAGAVGQQINDYQAQQIRQQLVNQLNVGQGEFLANDDNVVDLIATQLGVSVPIRWWTQQGNGVINAGGGRRYGGGNQMRGNFIDIVNVGGNHFQFMNAQQD